VVPNVPVAFYSFHIMVVLGFYFVLLLILVLVHLFRNTLENRKFLLRLTIFTIPLAYLATQAGWVVAEMGRQPWVIQDLLPTVAAVSHINTSSVQVTFFLFAALFTALLIAELSIMFKQIKIGPK
jgi:cytochrome d ubiquinol oxidase subunit I